LRSPLSGSSNFDRRAQRANLSTQNIADRQSPNAEIPPRAVGVSHNM